MKLFHFRFVFIVMFLSGVFFIFSVLPALGADVNFEVNVFDSQPPTAPGNLRATDISWDNVVLAWDASTDNLGVSGYRLFYAQSNALIGDTSNTSYPVKNLTEKTTYSFYVKAYDANGNLSPSSNVLDITTEAKPSTTLVMTNAPLEVKAGFDFPLDIHVMPLDETGSVAEEYLGKVYFISSDSQPYLKWGAINPYAFTPADGGSHSFQGSGFQFNTTGKQILTVTDGNSQSSATINVVAPTILEQIGQILEKIREKIPEFLKKITENLNSALVTTATALVLIPIAINTTLNLISLFPNIVYLLMQFFQLIGVRRRRQPWGVIFDSQTGQPIAFAVTRIYGKQYNRLLETAISDSRGRYGFLTKQGIFFLTIQKAGYKFPSRLKTSPYYEDLYLGGDFQTSEKTVSFNIPMDPEVILRKFSAWVALVKVNRLFSKIRLPIIVAGSVIALFSFIATLDKLYLLSLFFYFLLTLLELLRSKKIRNYGLIQDPFGQSLETAIIRIYDQKTGRLISTDVTDAEGRYHFLISPGNYYLTAIKPGFQGYRSKTFHLRKEETLISINIQLAKG